MLLLALEVFAGVAVSPDGLVVLKSTIVGAMPFSSIVLVEHDYFMEMVFVADSLSKEP